MGTSAILSRDRKRVSTNDRGASHTAQLGSGSSLTNVKISHFSWAIAVRIREHEKIDKRQIALAWQPNGCTGKVEVDCAGAPLGLLAFLFAISIVGIF